MNRPVYVATHEEWQLFTGKKVKKNSEGEEESCVVTLLARAVYTDIETGEPYRHVEVQGPDGLRREGFIESEPEMVNGIADIKVRQVL